MDAFFTAYSALEAQMKIVDVLSNNLANSQSTGFKRDFGQVLEGADGFDVATRADMSEGQLINTGNGLDAAIDGSGFFVVQTPSGLRYTRNGSFISNAQGELVTKDGMPVLSTSGTPVSSTDGLMSIRDGGVVTANGNDVGTLKVVTFADMSKLQKEGLDRFQWNGDANQAKDVPEPEIKGGFLEGSNVNPVTEMVHLMSAYRDFESVQRAVKTMTTDMNSKLISELGRLN